MGKTLRVLCVIAVFFCGLAKVSAQAPVANFSASATTACAPALITFTDLSTGNPTSWLWNLGNSTTAINQNPSTSYTSPGTYTVTLTATNASGSNTKTTVNYITIVPAPIVGFTGTDTAISCVPKTVVFTNTSVPNSAGAATYLWDFGDGSFSTLQNPSHTYTVGGTYSVSLIVTNGVTCSNVMTRNNYVRAAPAPSSDFTSSNTSACTAPLNVNFTNTSSGSAISYQWYFGDGGTSTAVSPSHNYLTPGSYNVTLVGTSANGCVDTQVKPSYVNIGALIIGFNTSTNSTCTNKPISFTNTTLPSSGSSTWSFGDGNFSSNPNPTHSYTAPGTYTVKLRVNYNTCSDSTTRVVTITPAPAVSFTATNNLSCYVPQVVNFNNTSTNGASYQWDFGDGGTSTAASPSHNYTAAGQYTVRLIVTSANGCVDTLIKTNYVNLTPLSGYIEFSRPAELGCAPVTIGPNAQITSPLPIVNYFWDWGDGGTSTGNFPSHTYTSPGIFVVTLTVTTSSGCTFTTVRTAYVGTHLTPSFTATPTSICLGQSVTFTNTTAAPSSATYTWQFGDGGTSYATSPTYFYGNFGIFSPELISNNFGCVDTFKALNLITVTPPKADFSPIVSCSNHHMVSIVNNSVGAITAYTWNFDDGSPVFTGLNPPPHNYPMNGTYNISLTVTNGVCTHTVILPVYIFDLTANFTAAAPAVCFGTPISFTADSDPNYVKYLWYFGDGTKDSSTTNTMTHAYATTGIYTASLVIVDRYNCRDSIARPAYISVNGIAPAFSANITNGCSPVNITFTDLSTTTSPIASRVWTFGDGNVGTAPTTATNHMYANPGTYSVTLALTDVAGCAATLTKPNYIVLNRPVAAYAVSNNNVCLGTSITFANSSTGTGSLLYNWSFGDATSSTLQNPTHLYTTVGAYSVRLIVTDGTGCKDTLIQIVNVSKVVAGFTPSDTVGYCPPLNVNFANISTGGSSYLWDFGNGNTSTSFNASNVYTIPGTYTVRLIVLNSAGCRDTMKKTVRVNAGATGSFTYSPLTGCFPLTVNFTATTNNATSVIFDFNNGNTATATGGTYSYTYTAPGFFLPVMIISSGPGCNTSIAGGDTIRINRVRAGFSASPNPVCLGGNVIFTDTSSVVGGVITSRNWAFGDGNFATGVSPTHTYTIAGTYNVRLISGTSTGCQDTAFRTVVINPKPTITVANQSICLGGSVALPASGALSYNWTPAATLSCSTCATPIASPSTTTTYTVTGTSTFGCTNSTTATVTVNPLPSTLSAGPNQSICQGNSAVLSPSGATSYTWTANPTLSCTTCTNPTATPLVTTTYFVTGNTTAGCSAGASVTITVNPKPTITTTNKAHCAGSSDTLFASGAISYVWSPATGLSCTACPSPIATPAATTTYTVTGTDANGCTNTATSLVTVNPNPTVTITGNTNICIGGSASLTASGSATSYSWTPAATLSCSTCANPIATPTATTTYTVTGTNAFGCTSTSTVTVTVNPLPSTLSAGPNQSICQGTTASLNATGASSYVWTASPTLSCTNCANPVASPTATTTYCVTGTSTAGCSSTACVTVTVLPKPTITTTNKAHCVGGTDTLLATGGVSYVWSPATGLSCTTCPNPIATPTATTTYTVTGTGTNGCINTATSVVTINPLPVITVTGSNNVCQGSGTTLTASGAATYVWSPATGLSCTACASPTATPNTTTTYTVTGTSAFGCIGSTTVTLNVNALPNVTAGNNQSTCLGTPVTLTASGASTYSWSPVTGLSCTNCPSPSANPTTTTTYIVTGTDLLGCHDTGMVTVTVKPLPNVVASADTFVCNLNSVQISATGASGYVWSPATTLSCSTCADPIASPTISTTYTVTGTGANGCLNSDQVTVSIYTQPVINAGPDQTICAGRSAQLQASGGNTYVWSPAATLSCSACPNPLATPPATINYKVVGTDVHGCNDSDYIDIRVIQRDSISVGPGGEICEGESFQLSATGGTGYSWTPSNTLNNGSIANPVATPRETTTYNVTIAQGQCFSDILSATVVVHPLPTVDAGPDRNIVAGTSTTLTTTGNNIKTYSWTPSEDLSCRECPEPVATPKKTTTYLVRTTSDFGCESSDEVTVFVTCDEKQLWLPNTFTPNGDGQNDRFYPHGKGITSINRFRIYDRWGEVVYDVMNMPTDDPNYGWDGYFKSQPLKPDVYIYIINAKCSTGEPLEIKGDITLMK